MIRKNGSEILCGVTRMKLNIKKADAFSASALVVLLKRYIAKVL